MKCGSAFPSTVADRLGHVAPRQDHVAFGVEPGLDPREHGNALFLAERQRAAPVFYSRGSFGIVVCCQMRSIR